MKIIKINIKFLIVLLLTQKIISNKNFKMINNNFKISKVNSNIWNWLTKKKTIKFETETPTNKS